MSIAILSVWLAGGGATPGREWRSGREETGVMGGVDMFGVEKRFVVPTLRPASCSERIRSAIVVPNLTDWPSCCDASELLDISKHVVHSIRRITCRLDVFSISRNLLSNALERSVNSPPSCCKRNKLPLSSDLIKKECGPHRHKISKLLIQDAISARLCFSLELA